jgi:gas vesicle protein
MSNTNGFLKGVFWGGAVGAIVALLSSPKSGKEIREELRRGSRKLYDEASSKLENFEQKIAAARDTMPPPRDDKNSASQPEVYPLPVTPDEVTS